jgi:hypothetical protein
MTILEIDRAMLRGDSAISGTSWGAIFAGAVAAVATTIILVVLGTGLGLASVSPWYRSGAGAATVGVAAITWLVVVQWLSSAIGGYMAGRLRSKWTGTIHDDEVFFRDTAHGFLAWCVASIAGAVLLAGTGAITLGGAAAGASGAVTGRGADQNAYFIDNLYRPAGSTPGAASAPPATPSAMPAMGAGGMASGNFTGMGRPNADRGETGRILTHDFSNGGVTPDDRAYLAQLVANRNGMSQADAQTRVDQTIAQMNAARKQAARISIVTALAMVTGAFIAAVAGAFAGRLREEHDVLYATKYATEPTVTPRTTRRKL